MSVIFYENYKDRRYCHEHGIYFYGFCCPRGRR